jgi:hypothetical protein
MQAPQSQFLSDVQVLRWQWCGDVEVASQVVLSGHLNPPPTHETSEQPLGVWFCPGPHAYPAGHV